MQLRFKYSFCHNFIVSTSLFVSHTAAAAPNGGKNGILHSGLKLMSLCFLFYIFKITTIPYTTYNIQRPRQRETQFNAQEIFIFLSAFFLCEYVKTCHASTTPRDIRSEKNAFMFSKKKKKRRKMRMSRKRRKKI